MLPPEVSPIHRLVSAWWRAPYPAMLSTCMHRIALWMAATEEMTINQHHGKVYDPLADNRFLWAAQWLDVGAKCRPAIDPAVTMAAEYIFEPPHRPSHQHAAAND